jgi:Ca2+/Na+ antiporter
MGKIITVIIDVATAYYMSDVYKWGMLAFFLTTIVVFFLFVKCKREAAAAQNYQFNGNVPITNLPQQPNQYRRAA